MSGNELIRFENLEMTYLPYPIGVMAPVFEQGYFDTLIDTFPTVEKFHFRKDLGNKYVLSEKTPGYDAFLDSSPPWKKLHSYIKSDDFIFTVLDAMKAKGVDLGLKRDSQSQGKRLKKALKSVMNGRIPNVEPPLYSRFDFSALPADGGVLHPHTDSPGKLITLVFSMVRPNEWDEAWGGGTDILTPKDAAKSFNHLNRQMDYAETDLVDTVHYKPNQAMLFVKTYNSLHGVKTMTGPENTIRRTLTVNIQRR